jgi:3-oxoacyl-[acyl-carrier-protein] synthase III
VGARGGEAFAKLFPKLSCRGTPAKYPRPLPVENAGLAKGNRILSSRWRQFRGGAANNHGQGAATANIVETVTMVRTPAGVRSMKLFWPLLILFQIWLASEISFRAFDAAHVSYRHAELVAALTAQEEHPSPETQAAVQNEIHLAGRHVMHQQLAQCGVLFVFFLALDVVFFYAMKNRRYKSPRV